MKHSEENDPVWKLLGNARKVEVDPFFSRNVTREIRKLQTDGADREGVLEVVLSWFKQPALVGAAAAFAVLLAVFLSDQGGEGTLVEVVPEVESSTEFAEIEGIGYLGELMAVNDPDEFDDAELTDLFMLASR